MTLRLTRRRFGHLAIAGTAATGLGYLANKTLALTPNLVVVGVRPGRTTSTDNAVTTEVDSTDPTTIPNNFSEVSTARPVIVLSLDIVTGQVKVLLETPDVLQPGEQLTGLTYLSDGTLVLALTPASVKKKGGNPTRLIFPGKSSTAVAVSGLKKQEKLESLLGTPDGKLIGLVVRKNGRSPVKLVNVNIQTGALAKNDRFTLPENLRFSNLAQCPDGKLYTTTVDKKGETSLVLLNPGQKNPTILAQLRFNGSVWNNGIQSLVCSAAGQLLALGALRYETPNFLHVVDTSTGNMTRIKPFDVIRNTVASL